MVLMLVACATPHPQPPPDTASGTASDTASDTDPGTTSTAAGARCTLLPALAEAPTRLRVSGDGALWVLDVTGVLTRYERQDGAGCALVGASIPSASDPMQAVTDIAVDAAGEPWALVFFDELRRLDPAGEADVSCEVTAGHTLAPQGDRVWVWGVGEEVLHRADVSGDACVASTEVLRLDASLSSTGRVGPGGLAAASFDASGDRPPGYEMDLETGAVSRELGTGIDPVTGDTLPAIADLVVAADGALVVDGFDGIWALDSDGAVTGMIPAGLLLAGAQEDDETPLSIDRAPDGVYYVATRTSTSWQVWLLTL